MHVSLFALATLLSFGSALMAQTGSVNNSAQNRADQLRASLGKLKSGDAGMGDIETIVLSKSVEAIPLLEAQFARTPDVELKGEIANALVRLGDKGNVYWNYLLEQATFAIDSEVPDHNYSPSLGKVMDDGVSPELETWAKAHGFKADTVSTYVLFDLPGKLQMLASTGDPRGVPFLRHAIQSHNCMMASLAAKGLAQIQDKGSIPLIIAAAEHSTDLCSAGIALALIFFDDPRAQSGVDRYVAPEMAKAFRDARKDGLGPFGYTF